MANWALEIQELDLLHQEEERVSLGVAKASPPNSPADDQILAASEHALGLTLDSDHRNFLMHANGWDRFSGNIDLFGTHDFIASTRFHQAQTWVREMDKRVLGTLAKHRAGCLPIGKSSASTDLLLMVSERGILRPQVFWFANELIETFADFSQLLGAFKEYERKAIKFWASRQPGSS